MNKVYNIFTIVMVVMLSSGFVSCSDDDEDFSLADISGTWYTLEDDWVYSISGNTAIEYELLGGTYGPYELNEWTIRYTIKGNKMTASDGFTQTISLKGETLILKNSEETLYLKRFNGTPQQLIQYLNNGRTDASSEEVKVRFVYKLDTSHSGSMTRSSGDELFDEFYEKISNGELVASDYNLTLTETTTGVKYEFNGKWSDKNMLSLRTGKYKVEGTSTAAGSYIQDRCSLSFNEEIDVTSSTATITLNAAYDCSLLIFTDSNISSIYYYETYTNDGSSGRARNFFTFSSYRYAFVNVDLQGNARINGQYTNGATFVIYTKGLKFDKGKYYIYNSISNSFTVPKMEQGE